jgi:hypothetical protein
VIEIEREKIWIIIAIVIVFILAISAYIFFSPNDEEEHPSQKLPDKAGWEYNESLTVSWCEDHDIKQKNCRVYVEVTTSGDKRLRRYENKDGWILEGVGYLESDGTVRWKN